MAIFLGTENDERIELEPSALLRHMVCLGSSGSGKTVAAKVVCEELARDGVPVIAIDPQGDIASLILPAQPELIESKGLDRALLDEYRSRVEVVIWTPASSVGVPLSVNPLALAELPQLGAEEMVRALATVAQNIAALVGYDLGNDEGRCVAGALHLVLEHLARARLKLGAFDQLALFLTEMPEELETEVGKLLSDKRLDTLRRKLHLLSIGAQQLIFQLGAPLSIDALLGRDETAAEGRTRISVVYLNTLHSQDEKEFFLAQIAQALYAWMLDHPSSEPQALFYIDEVAPYLPPVKKPACKESLTLLFKQARKYGICCLLASQNPGDIDYKCLAQFSTWAVGRVMVRQDMKKLERAIKSLAGADTEALIKALPKLPPGRFYLVAPDSFKRAVRLQVRWLLTEHETLDEDRIQELVSPALRRRFQASPAPARAKKTDPKPRPEAAPASPESPKTRAPDAPDPKASKPDAAPEPALPEATITLEPIKDSGAIEVVSENAADRLLRLLKQQRRALTVKELAVLGAGSEGTVRKALKELLDKKEVEREKAGRSQYHWASCYEFFPSRGVTEPLQVVRLGVFERDALAAARAETSSLFGLVSKELGDPSFEHLPLWQLRFTVKVTTGMLFWKETKERREHLYFHARSGELLLAGKDGIQFVSVIDKDPADIVDLDDHCAFERATPDEIGLEAKSLNRLLPRDEAIELAERKYPITAEHAALVFLPYWRFPLPKESRELLIDGVLGKPAAFDG